MQGPEPSDPRLKRKLVSNGETFSVHPDDAGWFRTEAREQGFYQWGLFRHLRRLYEAQGSPMAIEKILDHPDGQTRGE